MTIISGFKYPTVSYFKESPISKFLCMLAHKQDLAHLGNKGYEVAYRFNKSLVNQIQKTGRNQENKVTKHSLGYVPDNSCVRISTLLLYVDNFSTAFWGLELLLPDLKPWAGVLA